MKIITVTQKQHKFFLIPFNVVLRNSSFYSKTVRTSYLLCFANGNISINIVLCCI